MTDKTDDARGLLLDLIGQYWDCAYMEGKTGVSRGDEANKILARITAHLAAPAPEPRVAENLAMMLRRLIYQINKLDGDSSLKVLSGKASDLLSLYGLQGSPLRELPPLPKEQK